MQYEILQQGLVTQCEPGSATALACGPRVVVTSRGEVLCSYMVHPALGVNGFKPKISRSSDGGATWHEQGLIWPDLQHSHSIFGSISLAPDGTLFFFGSRTPIEQPGEKFWCESTNGIKQNELVFAQSADEGATWTEPKLVPMMISGSAEAPGPMCIMRSGRWVCCYSPYNTFDSAVTVDRNQVVCLSSGDQGETWAQTSMLRFADKNSFAAEAWVIELSDGRLLGAAWHSNEIPGAGLPNAYAISQNGGLTWSPTASTGIRGQSSALAALSDGRALFIYNQRQHGEIGVWLAVARPTETDFGIEANAIIWHAERATRNGTSSDFSNWTDYSFGEPSITLLPDGNLLATLWYARADSSGIQYVKLSRPA
ncbi:MAG: exo-alpha-sialidase [Pirellulales bacterium]|nr:exo-alpha-sialidase [Pirellulales bacterium]